MTGAWQRETYASYSSKPDHVRLLQTEPLRIITDASNDKHVPCQATSRLRRTSSNPVGGIPVARTFPYNMATHDRVNRLVQCSICKSCHKYLLDPVETRPCIDILLRDQSLERIRADLQPGTCDTCRFFHSLFGAIRDVRKLATNFGISEDFEADEISFISPDCLHVILQGKKPELGNINKLTAEVYTDNKNGRYPCRAS